MYARWNGSSWDIDYVDGFLGYCAGQFSSLALDSNDYPHISYYDLANDNLKYAAWKGSGWDIEVADSDGYVGQYTSLALDSNDYPHISYMDLTFYDFNLKYAARPADWDSTDIEPAVRPVDNGLLLSWSVTGDTPASVCVLRGESDPVAVSGSLPGGTTRWLDREVEPGEAYVYWLEATDSAGHTESFGPTEPVVVPEADPALTLDAPWPNPATDGVSLSFALPEAQSVSLGVYDLAGRRVSVLVDDDLAAGRHETTWDCSGVARGVYLIRLETAEGALTRRVVIER